MANWKLKSAYSALEQDFGSLEQVFALQGERLSKDRLSEVVRVERQGVRYYVKRYWDAGKGIRRFLGKPRIKGEWQNLRHFIRWGVPTAPVVAYGLERHFGGFVRGALITQEIPNTEDLAQLAKQQDARLHNRAWVAHISQQLAQATRILHHHRFTHNDLKWRNLLVNTEGQLFLIDCPSGGFWRGPWLSQRIIKDLACLDKVGKYQLSRTQRLRFYLNYRQQDRLKPADKSMIDQIVRYFEGRE